MVSPVLFVDVLDNLLPAIMLDVKVDVRWFGALPGDKSFE
jgi:hypothetical protein